MNEYVKHPKIKFVCKTISTSNTTNWYPKQRWLWFLVAPFANGKGFKAAHCRFGLTKLWTGRFLLTGPTFAYICYISSLQMLIYVDICWYWLLTVLSWWAVLSWDLGTLGPWDGLTQHIPPRIGFSCWVLQLLSSARGLAMSLEMQLCGLDSTGWKKWNHGTMQIIYDSPLSKHHLQLWLSIVWGITWFYDVLSMIPTQEQ